MVRVVASQDKRVPAGWSIKAINGQQIEDFLEFKFYNDASKLRRVLIESNGTSRHVVYKPQQHIAVTLESPRYRQCVNDCDFCFINGLPDNVRRELYFRDDDYRLSFLFGNFLSLTNVDQRDIARIGRLRLSPLYVSVHTTDPKLRIKLFKNEEAGNIMQTLKQLVDNNVKIHCQIVVIPGITSGRSLTRTIKDLSRLYPGVTSIGVVPVGKTKYSVDIPSVSKKLANSIIEFGERYNRSFRKQHKTGLVYLADELYVKTGRLIPPRKYYDDFPQYENGIGMVRVLLDEIASIRKVRKSKGKYLILSGRSAVRYLKSLKARLEPDINIDIKKVRNDFFGDTVTVAGLLAARDLNDSIAELTAKYDRIFLPPDCVNEKGQFLDGKKIENPNVSIAPTSLKELLKCLR